MGMEVGVNDWIYHSLVVFVRTKSILWRTTAILKHQNQSWRHEGGQGRLRQKLLSYCNNAWKS